MAGQDDKNTRPTDREPGLDRGGEVSAVPAAGDRTPSQVHSQAQAGGNAVAIGKMLIGDNCIVSFQANSGGEPFQKTWADPSRPSELPEPLADIPRMDLERAGEQLLQSHILLIECIDFEMQLAAAAKVLQHTGIRAPAVQGTLSGEAAPNGMSEEDDARWTLKDITHEQLAGGRPCVLLLELDGARGQDFVDWLFNVGTRPLQVSDDLRARKRHLILLPRGSTAEGLQRDRARRGFHVDVLRVAFPEPWVRRHFPADADDLLVKTRKLLERAEWIGQESLLYERLCGLNTGESVRQELDRLLAGNSDQEQLVQRVQQALDCTDGKDEPLLSAVFVAALLPGLSQHDFARVAEKFLEGRTRTDWVTPPSASADGGTRPVETQISLAKEWRTGLRPIMKSAHLELRPSLCDRKVVDFRGGGVPSSLKPLLKDAPLFMDQQLERIRAAKLLFDRSEAVREAVTNLVVEEVRQEPGRYDSDWILGLLLRIDADTQDIPLTAATAEMHLEELDGRHLSGARNLLHRLEPSMVSQIFEKLIRLGTAPAADFLLALTWRLKDSREFKPLHWIRQVLERGKGESRAQAVRTLRCILQIKDRDSVADLIGFLAWLPPPGQNGGASAEVARSLVSGWCSASIQFASGIRTGDVSAAVNFLQRVAAQGGAEGVQALVTAVLRQDIVEVVSGALANPGEMVARLLFPQGADNLDLESWVDAVGHRWNSLVEQATADFGSATLSIYLLPALTLAVWCELFARQEGAPPAIPPMAAALRSALNEERRTSVQLWLGILSDVMGVSANQVMEQPGMSRAAQDQILVGISEQRERIEQLQAEVNRSPIQEAPSHALA